MSSLNDLLRRLQAQGAPPSQLARLSDLVALAGREPALCAVALVGSHAKGSGDRISDLDLVAIAAPGRAAPVLQAARALLEGAPLLDHFSGRHAAGGLFCKMVFLDFTSVEFHVFEPDTRFRLRRPWLTVWDPDQRLGAYVADGEPIRHEDFAAYEYGDEGLIWELVDCIKWLSRGRRQLARHHLLKLAAEISRRERAAADAVLIRTARPDDALCLGVLGLQVFLDTYATAGIRATVAREVLGSFSTAAFAAHLCDPSTLILVAEQDAHLVGFAQVTLDAAHELAPPGVPAQLLRLYVQEPFTGGGLGTRLLRAAEAAAAARGAQLLWLTPWVHNRRALAFYAARGYVDQGQTWYRFEGEAHENRLLARSLDEPPDDGTPP